MKIQRKILVVHIVKQVVREVTHLFKTVDQSSEELIVRNVFDNKRIKLKRLFSLAGRWRETINPVLVIFRVGTIIALLDVDYERDVVGKQQQVGYQVVQQIKI